MLDLKSPTVMQDIDKVNIKINRINTELDEYYTYQAQGAIFRSKLKWHLEGQKNMKYFMNLEKSRAVGKTMTAIKLHSGKVTQNNKEILRIQGDFYKRLYTKDPAVKFKYENENVPKLSKEFSDNLNAEITEHKISLALKQMARNRSPGPDGWTADFYKVFWKDLKVYISQAIQYAVQTGCFHATSRRGVLSLLPKKDRDLLLVKN